MFARVATFEDVELEEVEKTAAAARERLGSLFDSIPGWRGALDLADRSSGKVVSITLFDSDENMNAAEPVFDEEMPRRLGELMEGWAGRRTGVEHFEVIFEQLPSG